MSTISSNPSTKVSRKQLIQERDALAAKLDQMEATEKAEFEKLPHSKAYSNLCIRYAAKERAKVKLENVKEQLSKKVPSEKEIAQLKSEKIELETATAILMRKEAALQKHNPWKLYNDYDFVTLPIELNTVKIDTLNRKIKKFENKKLRQSLKE